MRILLIGFFAFLTWSVFSTQFYVCKIKKLCAPELTLAESIRENPVDISPLTSHVISPGIMTVNFAFDRFDFNPDAGTDNFFTKSKAFLDQNATARLIITGFTDSIGSGKYNMGLGYRRAQALQMYFENKGMTFSKMQIESKGEKDPVSDNNTVSGRSKNRRVVITMN